jgi:hypothetical protein
MISRNYLDENLRKARRRHLAIQKWLLTIGTILVMSIPADLFFIIKGSLNPEGFWQNFAVWVGGIAVFGAAQIWFVVLGLGFLVTVIWKD